VRRDVTAGMPAHSVGDHHKKPTCKTGVLVALANEPDVGGGGTVRRHD